MTIRVLVADDQQLIRIGLAGIVDTAPDLKSIGSVATGRDAVAAAAEHRPDVVLMDVRMPEMDGIEATRRITAAGHARVLMLTTFDLDEYVFGALRAGASGFLLKDAPHLDLLSAVRTVAQGEALLAPRITKRLIAAYVNRPAQPSRGQTPLRLPEAVTTREREVLLLVAEGLTNAEIAERLYIGAGTVKTHVARLLTKLDARDRVQLVIHAYRSGLTG
ncbi:MULTISPECIES: response regulator [Streptomyces]|uniref:Response regulator transcription factor n=1 Tax=Streptomyces mirabilis TaxID=68239 RepID=A0ABU3UAS5_9ACTN|nr:MULTISPECIES: response regulator transcription factor [Streptomyces]MCX4615634.1 response regulator transcription factor [Streptomyces mirabilis]MCX5355426.1 response regulator transcription factor [Streptomyces mirabilis]MDU8991009.1 response regulator transcription factor [Streptomyces mirabilis]QDN83199.1 response regulator transcription factor [Streptomyces sp. S1A1-7]QDN93128.1 response regulator transcription factor [Streptomyces sp. RLB3-6]